MSDRHTRTARTARQGCVRSSCREADRVRDGEEIAGANVFRPDVAAAALHFRSIRVPRRSLLPVARQLCL